MDKLLSLYAITAPKEIETMKQNQSEYFIRNTYINIKKLNINIGPGIKTVYKFSVYIRTCIMKFAASNDMDLIIK